MVETKVTFTGNLNSSQMIEISKSLNSANICVLTLCMVLCGPTFKQLSFPVKLQRMMAKECKFPFGMIGCLCQKPRWGNLWLRLEVQKGPLPSLKPKLSDHSSATSEDREWNKQESMGGEENRERETDSRRSSCPFLSAMCRKNIHMQEIWTHHDRIP